MESLDVAKTRDGVHGPTQMTQHQDCLTRRADETTSAAMVLPSFATAKRVRYLHKRRYAESLHRRGHYVTSQPGKYVWTRRASSGRHDLYCRSRRHQRER